MKNSVENIYRFEKTSNNTWAESYRGYDATIAYVPGPNPYSLIVNATIIGSYDTWKLAVIAFKNFLSNKPVLI